MNGMVNGKRQILNGKSGLNALLRKSFLQLLPFAMFHLTFAMSLSAAPTATAPGAGGAAIPGNEQIVEIKGQFKGRFAVKKIIAPVTMNLEKLQDFPEDPSQRILLDPLPISQGSEFNARSEVKGHAPFYPWIMAIPEPPFLRMTPPKNVPTESWMFEVFNPQGQTIYRQRGTNNLPDELIWEGRDSEKKFAVVDRLYSAQLTLIAPGGKATIISGDSVVLPAMIYGSAESETVEFSLNRMYSAGKPDLSPEGHVMLGKIGERVREMGTTRMHVRIAADNQDLSALRETTLVKALEKSLHLSEGLVEHDHSKPTTRGEIVSFWIKTGGGR